MPKPKVNTHPGKHSFITITPKNGGTFTDSTVTHAVEDRLNSITFHHVKDHLSPDKKSMTIKLTGKGRPTAAGSGLKTAGDPGKLGGPDAGTLTITLADPPGTVLPDEPTIEVEYVDDPNGP